MKPVAYDVRTAGSPPLARFRRAGIEFGPSVTRVSAEQFSEDQLRELLATPTLEVMPVYEREIACTWEGPTTAEELEKAVHPVGADGYAAVAAADDPPKRGRGKR